MGAAVDLADLQGGSLTVTVVGMDGIESGFSVFESTRHSSVVIDGGGSKLVSVSSVNSSCCRADGAAALGSGSVIKNS